MRTSTLVVTLLTGVAAAQPAPLLEPAPESVDTAPADTAPTSRVEVRAPGAASSATGPVPLGLRELVARDQWTLSFATVAGPGAFAEAIEVSRSYALGATELFASMPAILAMGFCIEGYCPNRAGLGNLRAGVRHVHQAGPIALAAASWAWLPTQTAPDDWRPRERAIITAARDSRAFQPEAALGGALEAAWRSPGALVQAQLGCALVADGGPQVDNVFGALAASVRMSDATSLLGEWRVDAYPAQAPIHAFGAGFGHGDPATHLWRLRFHVVQQGASMYDAQRLGAVEATFDWMRAL